LVEHPDLGREEDLFGLETCEWDELRLELLAHLEAAAKAPTGAPTATPDGVDAKLSCPSCGGAAKRARYGYVPTRDLDYLMDIIAQELGRDAAEPLEPSTSGDPLTLVLHPEAPMLQRRRALSAVA
jgi:hypothetical protein